MHDYHPIPDDGADEGFDAGRLSSGMETLAKCLKAAFTLLVLVIACMFIWYFTYAGVIQVNSQESAIVLTFGKLEKVYGPGLHWALPYPVSTVVKVPASSQSILVSSDFMPADKSLVNERKPGMEMLSNPDAPLVPGKDGYLITGDANIIHTEWEFSYRIVDPRSYYENFVTPANLSADDGSWIDPRSGLSLGPRGPRTLLRDLFVNTVIEVTSSWKAQDILRPSGDKKVTYNEAVDSAFKKAVAEIGAGIVVDGVYLRIKSPPPQSIAAFSDVISAEQESAKEKEIAKAYAIERVASAEEAKARMLADAIGYKRRVVSDVAASESVFKEILKQYRKSPESVQVSLYTSGLADALELVKDKFVLTRNAAGQELRLKLNPEPPTPPNKNEARRDSK